MDCQYLSSKSVISSDTFSEVRLMRGFVVLPLCRERQHLFSRANVELMPHYGRVNGILAVNDIRGSIKSQNDLSLILDAPACI